MITSEPVVLKGGHVVTLDALKLQWRLEAAGLTIECEADKLAIGPRELLTDVDRQEIRRHRDELLRFVDYVDARGWEM